MLKEKQSAYEFMNKQRVELHDMKPLEVLPKNIFMADPDEIMKNAHMIGVTIFLMLLIFSVCSCVISGAMFLVDIISKHTLSMIILSFSVILMAAMVVQMTYLFSANLKANQIRKNS